MEHPHVPVVVADQDFAVFDLIVKDLGASGVSLLIGALLMAIVLTPNRFKDWFRGVKTNGSRIVKSPYATKDDLHKEILNLTENVNTKLGAHDKQNIKDFAKIRKDIGRNTLLLKMIARKIKVPEAEVADILDKDKGD